MKTSSRFFLKSVAVAALLVGGGLAYSGYTQNKLSTVQRVCENESKARMASFNAQHAKETGPWSIYQTAGFLCDPSKLDADIAYGEDTPGIQGELLTAYREANDKSTQNLFYVLSLLAVLIGILPATWYFFLARLAEIAAAVRRG